MFENRERAPAHLVRDAARLLVMPVVDACALEPRELRQRRVEGLRRDRRSPSASPAVTASRPKNAGYSGTPACIASHSSRGPSSSGNDAMSRMLLASTASNSGFRGAEIVVARRRHSLTSRSRASTSVGVGNAFGVGRLHRQRRSACPVGSSRRRVDAAPRHDVPIRSVRKLNRRCDTAGVRGVFERQRASQR